MIFESDELKCFTIFPSYIDSFMTILFQMIESDSEKNI